MTTPGQVPTLDVRSALTSAINQARAAVRALDALSVRQISEDIPADLVDREIRSLHAALRRLQGHAKALGLTM